VSPSARGSWSPPPDCRARIDSCLCLRHPHRIDDHLCIGRRSDGRLLRLLLPLLLTAPLRRRLFAEALGSVLLAAIVVGSGIAAERLSPNDIGLELLENAAATAAGLYVLILVLGPVSGAHLNPLVSIADAAFGSLRWRDALAYLPAQVGGCIAGAVLADLMFASPTVTLSHKHRASSAHLVSEVVATAGLVLVVFALRRAERSEKAAGAVAAYIGAAYFFTSSTSFANPAITVGRMLSNSFAGIAPVSVPGFVAAQVVGAALGALTVRVLYPERKVVP
jgi:glycerol uptake facilitator-like aquaporin